MDRFMSPPCGEALSLILTMVKRKAGTPHVSQRKIYRTCPSKYFTRDNILIHEARH